MPEEQKEKITRTVSPETAAFVTEEDLLFATTIETAQSLAKAAVDAANSIIAAADKRHTGAMRGVFRELKLDLNKFQITAVNGVELDIEPRPSAPAKQSLPSTPAASPSGATA